MLHDFTHPVCRACCNYEGTDRIAEVLDKVKHLRQAFDTALPVSEAMALKVSHADMAAAVNLMPAVTVATAGRPMMRHSGPTYAVIPQPGKVLVSSAPFLGLTQPQAVSVDRGAPIPYAAMQPHPVHVAEPTQLQTHYSTTWRFAQIKDTLNTLSKSPPFRVHFSKDHSHRTCHCILCRFQEHRLRSQSLHRVPHRLSDHVPERLWCGETDVLRVP